MESLQKAIRLTFFDQRTARQVMFEQSATADAVMIVAAVHAIVLWSYRFDSESLICWA